MSYINLSKEQFEAHGALLRSSGFDECKYFVLNYLEKEFGPLNKVTVDFRKSLNLKSKEIRNKFDEIEKQANLLDLLADMTLKNV